MKKVIIHCKESALDLLKDRDLYYVHNNGELDVTVYDVEYDLDHIFVDPDEQICDYYGIDYDLVNCVESA